jgi:hypothetical protein
MLLGLSLAAVTSLSGCVSDPPGSAATVGAVLQIEGVDVQVDGSGPGAAVNVHADVSSPSGGVLGFFWSGACLSGVVQGSSTITLSLAGLEDDATPAASPVVRVVVEDAAGVAASADIVLTIAEGSVQGTLSTPASAECLGAQAQCAASCNAGVAGGPANASCLAGCGASLATCAAQ